jgi:hypothetical protein
MKKIAEGGGIREGKARFGDDVRERARKAIAEQMAKAENKSKFGGKEPVATAKKVSAPKVIKPKPIPKAETKSADRSSDRLDREPPTAQSPKTETKVEKKSGQFGPATTFPRDVGAGKAAEARKKSFDGSNPFSDLMDLLRGKKNGGTIKKSSGGSVSKRADGIAQRGKTKGRMV